jgi:hypothetical protein
LIKSRYISPEEWDKNPANRLKNPKLTEEEAQRIADEAIAGGQKWDVQEDINAHRRAERNAECGGGLGKILAPAKFDSEPWDWADYSTSAGAGRKIRPLRRSIPLEARCQAGEGAYGTYFVHPSEKYGIKLFRGTEDDVASEFRRLDKADYAGVNVPTPLHMNAIKDADGDVRDQTLVMSHMKGYRPLSNDYTNGFGSSASAPLIVGKEIVSEFRKLHTAGLAHGDIHGKNILFNQRDRKVALVDFGYATELHDGRQPSHTRDGVMNLMYDMKRLPDFLGFNDRGNDFLRRYKGVLQNVEKQAKQLAKYGGPDNEQRFTIAVKRYHDALETELLQGIREPRSRFISGADQPRIPGLTRRIVTANANTFQRGVMEQVGAQGDPSLFAQAAKRLGVKPANLSRALRPERDARRARNRARPFGTNPFPRGTPRRPAPVRPVSSWKD